MGKKTETAPAIAPKPAPTYTESGTPAPAATKPGIETVKTVLELFKSWAPFYENLSVRSPPGLMIPVPLESLGKLRQIGESIVFETRNGVLTVSEFQLHGPRNAPRTPVDNQKAATDKQLKALQAKVADGLVKLEISEGETKKLVIALDKASKSQNSVDQQFGSYRKQLEELAQLKKENKRLADDNAKLQRHVKKLAGLEEAPAEKAEAEAQEAQSAPPKAPTV